MAGPSRAAVTPSDRAAHVKAVRLKHGMSQREWVAAGFASSLSALRAQEQGRKRPSQQSTLLTIMLDLDLELGQRAVKQMRNSGGEE